jgi:hypothetical protein
MEPDPCVQRIMVWFEPRDSVRRWPGLCVLCSMLLLSWAGCSMQSGIAERPMPNADWPLPDAAAETASAPNTCGAATNVQPLDVSNLGEGKTRDSELADRITKYLNDHCLPLVRASITREPDGAPGILLYGFVASDSGKRNAEAEAAALLADSGIEITDVILIRPQLASTSPNNPDTSKEPDAADASGQFDSAAQQLMLQQYQNQDDNGASAILAPLLGLGIFSGAFGGSSSVFVSPGSGWNPAAVPNFGLPFGAPAGGIGRGPYPGTFTPLP